MSFRTWLESKRSEGTAAFVMDAAESKWSYDGEWRNDPFIVELKKELAVNDDFWGDQNLDFDKLSDRIAREVAMKAPTDTAAGDLALQIIFAIFRSGDEKAIESAKKLGRAYIENKDKETYMKGMREVFHSLNDLNAESVEGYQLGDLVRIKDLEEGEDCADELKNYLGHNARIIKVDRAKGAVIVSVIHRGIGRVLIEFDDPARRLEKPDIETYGEKKIRESEENPNPNLLEDFPE